MLSTNEWITFTNRTFRKWLLFAFSVIQSAYAASNSTSFETAGETSINVVRLNTFTLPPTSRGGFGHSNNANRLSPSVRHQTAFTLGPPRPVRRPQLPQQTHNQQQCTNIAISTCSQVAWADITLALSGIKSKFKVCGKYTPSTSCVSRSLAECAVDTDTITRSMLIAIGRVFVTWCYDNGYTIAMLDRHSSCYAGAILHAITFDKCLEEMKPTGGLIKSVFAAKKSSAGLSLPGIMNALMGNFGTHTLRCMYASIELTCGTEAAETALKAAIDEFDLKVPTPKPEDIPAAVWGTRGGAKNETIEFYQAYEEDDISSKNLNNTNDAACRERPTASFALLVLIAVVICLLVK